MNKIISVRGLPTVVKQLKSTKQKIILAGGCFDIIHAGHIEYLKKSKALDGILLVLLESDATIKKLKGKNRPVYSQEKRAVTLANLGMVDYIICLPPLKKDSDYDALVKKIKPDIIAVTEGDSLVYKKQQQAGMVSGKVVFVTKRLKNYSTTDIVNTTTLPENN